MVVSVEKGQNLPVMFRPDTLLEISRFLAASRASSVMFCAAEGGVNVPLKNWRELQELVGLFGQTGVPVCQGI